MEKMEMNGYGLAGESESQPSAVRRLEQVRSDQQSLWKEVCNNWQGWLGSTGLHMAIFLLFAAVGYTVVQDKPITWIATDYFDAPTQELTSEPLPNLFEGANIETRVDGLPSGESDDPRPVPGYNYLTPGAPDYISSGGGLLGDGEGGGGGERMAGKGWRGTLAGFQRQGLEVMFVFDSTGSMGGIILEVKARIRQLTRFITFLVPNAKVGFVTYRDWKKYDLDDYEYTVKYIPLEKCNKDGVDKLQHFLRETEAYGGGDIPEAVQLGVQTAIEKAGWSPRAKKVIIVFGDAPPHPEDNGLARTYDLCRKFHDKEGGVVSCIDTTGGSKLMDEFRQMAADGGGEATFLNDERAIAKQLGIFIFGSRWKTEVEKSWAASQAESRDVIEEQSTP